MGCRIQSGDNLRIAIFKGKEIGGHLGRDNRGQVCKSGRSQNGCPECLALGSEELGASESQKEQGCRTISCIEEMERRGGIDHANQDRFVACGIDDGNYGRKLLETRDVELIASELGYLDRSNNFEFGQVSSGRQGQGAIECFLRQVAIGSSGRSSGWKPAASAHRER